MVFVRLNNQDMELKFNVNEVCALEEKSGKGIMALLSEQNIGFNVIRLLIWAGLRHKQQNLIIETVGNWLQSAIENGETLNNLTEQATKALTESGILGKVENSEVGEMNPAP